MMIRSKKTALLVGIVASLLAGATIIEAKQIVVPLGQQHLGTHSPADTMLGSYYTFSIPIPAAITGKELFGAYLEFYVDATALEVGDVANDSPRLEVYALAGSLGESLDAEDLATAALHPGNVMVGSNRRVMRDVTDIVRGYLETPQSNHGLVLGSLTGSRDGLFTLKPDVLGKGVVARLILNYRDR